MRILRSLILAVLLCASLDAQVSAPTRITIQDEGVGQGRAGTVNFTGSAVTASVSGGVATVNVSAGGAVTITEFELDFTTCGISTSIPSYTCKVVVTDASVGTGSKILISQSGNAATGRTTDENEMDFLACNALPAAGSFTLRCGSLFGPMNGKYKVFYTVG